MHQIFLVKTDDIQNLNDAQSRELIARLCRAELKSQSISESAVTWGGDQRAKDGGVDVRVEIDPPKGINGYIKSDNCAFQVKAENFSASKIPGEMAPKGILRPAIIDLSRSNGTYVIVSTRDDLSDSSLSDRIDAMKKCIFDNGLAGKINLDFYDCRKVADWIEQHPAIAVWAKDALGKALIGWKPYAPWAYRETDLQDQYLIDDKVKVFAPDSDVGISAIDAISQLRVDLSKNAAVRLVGLSGVGKTRLVQALFDKRIATEPPVLDANNVIYTDLADNPTPQPSVIVEALATSRLRTH